MGVMKLRKWKRLYLGSLEEYCGLDIFICQSTAVKNLYALRVALRDTSWACANAS